jgi:lactoylglutathione lyase
MESIHLSLVVIQSSNLDRVLEFYRAIGLNFVCEKHGNGPEHYSCDLDGVIFEIYPRNPDLPCAETCRIGFRVDSIADTISRLHQIGAAANCTPKSSPWGCRAVVKDPDGRSVELTDGVEDSAAPIAVARQSIR